MNSTRIHTVSDLIESIASAISERDRPAFDLAERIVSDWLISQAERNALMALIEAAREATWELADIEEQAA